MAQRVFIDMTVDDGGELDIPAPPAIESRSEWRDAMQPIPVPQGPAPTALGWRAAAIRRVQEEDAQERRRRALLQRAERVAARATSEYIRKRQQDMDDSETSFTDADEMRLSERERLLRQQEKEKLRARAAEWAEEEAMRQSRILRMRAIREARDRFTNRHK